VLWWEVKHGREEKPEGVKKPCPSDNESSKKKKTVRSMKSHESNTYGCNLVRCNIVYAMIVVCVSQRKVMEGCKMLEFSD
jgi:hypothetical protein